MKTLVIIPAYNEEDSIVGTVEELMRVAPQYDYVVINDGSKDGTRCICREHGFRMLDLPANVGLTYGFQAGIKYALRMGYDAAIQFDADGQHRPEYIKTLVDEMERTEADIVIGSRFVTEKKSHSARMIGSCLISAITRFTTGAKIKDPTSGMRLYRSTVFQSFCRFNDFGPEPDSIAYLIHKGAKVVECQVEMRDRMAGESYLNLTRSIEYMLRTCASILFVQWFR
ncbi:glycosyltransferase family 2 protein [Collinsella sp. An307]|uniref:glycosyltransferase family 2 protein n=1 Tax=Collinsella sp. An307 TaxID=1965630 RepID=UPI000B3AAFA6|nr:glycosyltransferase family 2 protein [Collinsella sp. An307]OUO21805.1 glycosyl transferase family 2 [Collinsella sp. An307]